jgi:hypothetical protein
MQKRSFGKSGGALAPLFFGTVLKRAPLAEGMATVFERARLSAVPPR